MFPPIAAANNAVPSKPTRHVPEHGQIRIPSLKIFGAPTAYSFQFRIATAGKPSANRLETVEIIEVDVMLAGRQIIADLGGAFLHQKLTEPERIRGAADHRCLAIGAAHEVEASVGSRQPLDVTGEAILNASAVGVMIGDVDAGAEPAGSGANDPKIAMEIKFLDATAEADPGILSAFGGQLKGSKNLRRTDRKQHAR